MSHPIDVGTVLGGRYQVTANVLTSHDQDLVLDGVDQVLNRPVSILVAGPGHAHQVAQSAREVATGERPGHVQILDLGVSDAATYLITSHTSAPDLLDLMVAANPPYVEPFFTDTLGSEIFGQARSHEPEADDEDEDVDAGYIRYGNHHAPQVNPFRGVPPALPPRPPARPTSIAPNGTPSAGDHGVGVAGLAAGASQHTADPESPAPVVPEPDRGRQFDAALPDPSHIGAESIPPKVSLWSEEDYYSDQEQESQDVDSYESEGQRQGDRPAGLFPAFARVSHAPRDGYEDAEAEKEPRSMRWLVGGLLAAVLIVGLVFAVGNLGNLFGNQGDPTSTAGAIPTEAPSDGTSGGPSPTQTTVPVSGLPVIDEVTRLGNFDFATDFDADLVKAIDGRTSSYWSDMEFPTDNWGGLAPDGVALLVKLEGPSKISSITLNQLGASGGSISVFTNDRPSLDGAKQVGTDGFTSPALSMTLAEPVTAQYVIVSIDTLPKLSAPKTRFGFGLRLAEIKIQ